MQNSVDVLTVRPTAELSRTETFFASQTNTKVKKTIESLSLFFLCKLRVPISSLGQKRMSQGCFGHLPGGKPRPVKVFRTEVAAERFHVSKKYLRVTSCLASYVIVSRRFLRTTFPVCMLHFSQGGELTTEPDVMLLCRIFVSLILNLKQRAYSEKRG